MTIPRIHVHTQSDKGTINYVKFMWSTMRALATRPEFLKLSVHCMSAGAVELARHELDGHVDLYQVPSVGSGIPLAGSMGHGACVEHALAMTNDGDIHIIVDSDTVVVAKSWDEFIRIEAYEKRIGTVGATYENIGEFTTGAGKVQTYKGKPNVVWMMLSPFYDWTGLRALPSKDRNVHITNERLSKIYGLPVGYQAFCDVAWQIPEYLDENNITFDGWYQRKPARDAVVLKNLSNYHEEYHVTEGEQTIPFVVHHRGSLRHRYRSEGISSKFFNAVDEYLKQELEHPPRWAWQSNVAYEMSRCEIEERLSCSKLEKLEPKNNGDHDQKGDMLHAQQQTSWIKVTCDFDVVWPRSLSLPVKDPTIDVEYDVSFNTKHIRVEGTGSQVKLRLPSGQERMHSAIIRNMVDCEISIGCVHGSSTVNVEPKSCQLVLIDTDGVVPVSGIVQKRQ